MLVGLVWAIIVVSGPGLDLDDWRDRCLRDGGTRIAIYETQLPIGEGMVHSYPFIWCWDDTPVEEAR